MNKQLLIAGILVLATAGCSAQARERSDSDYRSEATYVGSGRYACHDNTASCAAVTQGNEYESRSRRYESEARDDRVNRYMQQSKERQRRIRDAGRGAK